MLNKSIKTKIFKALLAGACVFTLGASIVGASYHYQAHAATAYDISEYQGYLTPSKVKKLKHEVSFLVLRVQYGGLVNDYTFAHNANLLQKYHIPYGVYSYSLYANPAQAKAEAYALHKRAPKAKFYANDLEENHARSSLNRSTIAWSNEIHKISNRPTILYSGEYFMNTNISQATRNKYNAIWLAAYGVEPATPYHYDLWQFSSDYYSRALGQALDADTFPDGNNKTLQFWIGNGNKRGPSRHKRSIIKPMNTNTAKATVMAKNFAHMQKKSRHSKSAINYKNQINSLAQRTNQPSQQAQQAQNENNFQNQAIHNKLDMDNAQLMNKDKLINSLRNQLSSVKRMLNIDKHLIINLLNKRTNTSKFNSDYSKHTTFRSKGPKGKIAKGYYSSKHIHYVRVIDKNGINIYDHNDDKKLDHAHKGEIIHVLYFKPEKFHHHMITRAVGDYNWNSDGSPRQVVFTANKLLVHACNY